MSLKRPFVPKSDVKQWFTTTTTQPFYQYGRLKKTNIIKYVSSLEICHFLSSAT